MFLRLRRKNLRRFLGFYTPPRRFLPKKRDPNVRGLRHKRSWNAATGGRPTAVWGR